MLEEVDASFDDRSFIELHVGYPVHQQATDSIGSLVDDYRMANAIKLRCRC